MGVCILSMHALRLPRYRPVPLEKVSSTVPVVDPAGRGAMDLPTSFLAIADATPDSGLVGSTAVTLPVASMVMRSPTPLPAVGPGQGHDLGPR